VHLAGLMVSAATCGCIAQQGATMLWEDMCGAPQPHAARQVLERYTRALDISPAAPWQLQQLLSGREFSCYTVAHRGRVVAHADTEARLSNLYYRHIGVPQVRPAAAVRSQSLEALLFELCSGVSGCRGRRTPYASRGQRMCERVVQRQFIKCTWAVW